MPFRPPATNFPNGSTSPCPGDHPGNPEGHRRRRPGSRRLVGAAHRRDYVLNPWSGEWLKGMKIVLAELGLIGYQGTIPRKPDVFSGLGDKELRRQYILARCGFVQALFRRADLTEVPLYRGWPASPTSFETPSSLLSATFCPPNRPGICQSAGQPQRNPQQLLRQIHLPGQRSVHDLFGDQAAQ